VTGLLQDLIWWATLVAGRAMSVGWRARLGRGAVPAIAGFVVLLAVGAVNLFWSPRSVTPASIGIRDILAAVKPGDLTIIVAMYAAYPAGLALLLIAVLRAGRHTAPPGD
jgi:hypothetical protein